MYCMHIYMCIPLSGRHAHAYIYAHRTQRVKRCLLRLLHRVSYRGGAWNFPPRNLEIEYGYYCFVTGIKQQSCPRLLRSYLKGSKFKIFLDPPSRHANLCVREHAFASCYHPAMYHPVFLPLLKILYETLSVLSFPFLCTEILGRTSMHGYSCKCPIHLALYTCMDGCAHPDL